MRLLLSLIAILLVSSTEIQARNRVMSLSEAIQLALENNKELQARRLNLLVIRSQMFEASLTFPSNPELEIDQSTDALTSGSGEGSFQLSLSQEVEVGGQRAKRRAIVDANLRVAEQEIAALELALIREVRFAYSTVGIAVERFALSSHADSLAASLRDSAEVRSRSGLIPASDFTFLNLEYVAQEADLATAAVELYAARDQMSTLLGVSVTDSVDLVQEATLRPLPISDDSVVSLAIANRSEIRRSQLNQQVELAKRGLALAERTPNLRLSAFYVRERSIFGRDNIIGSVPGFDGLKDTDNLIGVRLGLPIPVVNRRKTEVKRSEAQIDLDKGIETSLLQQVHFEAMTAVRKFRVAEGNQRSLREVIPSADSLFILLQKSYVEGRTPVASYLVQKGQLLSAHFRYLDSRRAYAEAVMELERAVGLDWEAIR